MEINYNYHSRNIKFNAHSGGSFKYEESEKTISAGFKLPKLLIKVASKVISFVLKIIVKIRSEFSS